MPSDITFMWNLTYDINEYVRLREQTCGCGGEGLDWEFGTNYI